MFTVQINNRLKDIKESKADFGGVSIIALGNLFQLKPVMDGYIFKDIKSSDYSILAPNLWNKYFKMFELDEIMRQREGRLFAEILNRLREGRDTENDILKIKESITAHDSVIGAYSNELQDKIMRQISHVPLKNTKQLAAKLRIAEGGRTELAMNIRTDDGLTNGASNIVKLVQLTKPNTPSGIIWVLFDPDDVGRKIRTKFAQVVRKQFPLRSAAAKTVHRSQGDTQTQIVVNLNTKRAVSHIHYVALSRVTTMEGLYVTELGETKIAVDDNVVAEMQQLRTERILKLCFTPLYKMDGFQVKSVLFKYSITS
ncbi:ATP-dependent DNA helicase PIF1-like [Dendronephthya gigantea]|uniref:ATP-dependent DNA helicase PIF1-like n=1 Tax=Dendronephthya gigantea TaxID=151771 RepID=UPI00106C0DC8|nr:ATP-dependent DNA helicase PIF1-like [Dendronephthya gigantea]